MRYRTPEAFRAALDQRLKNEAAIAGVALMRLRKRVAFERFLARLSAAEPEGWVLIGASRWIYGSGSKPVPPRTLI